jgi:hypothetical protein
VREEWRVVDRWWTEQPVQRRYFDVILESGENAVVFYDVCEGNVANGDVANGDVANGDVANGDVSNGDASNGDASNDREVGRWYSQRA